MSNKGTERMAPGMFVHACFCTCILPKLFHCSGHAPIITTLDMPLMLLEQTQAASHNAEREITHHTFFHVIFSYVTSRFAYNPNRTHWLPVEEAKNSPAHQDLIMRDWKRAVWALFFCLCLWQTCYLTEQHFMSYFIFTALSYS